MAATRFFDTLSQIEIIKFKQLKQNYKSHSYLKFNLVDSEFSLEFFALIYILASLLTSRNNLIIQSVSDFMREENLWQKV